MLSISLLFLTTFYFDNFLEKISSTCYYFSRAVLIYIIVQN